MCNSGLQAHWSLPPLFGQFSTGVRELIMGKANNGCNGPVDGLGMITTNMYNLRHCPEWKAFSPDDQNWYKGGCGSSIYIMETVQIS